METKQGNSLRSYLYLKLAKKKSRFENRRVEQSAGERVLVPRGGEGEVLGKRVGG
jgi:hypothetical protein